MASSLLIQQALFFQPVQNVSSIIPFDPTDNHFGDHDSKIIYNPLLVAKFGPAFFKRGNAGIYTRMGHLANYFYKLPWSPRAAEYAKIDDWDELPDKEEPDPELVAEEKAIRRCSTRSGVSWRRMLVSQPPPPLLGYFMLDLHSGWNQISTAMDNIVIEFRHVADYGMYAGEPKAVYAFDADFRCDEFRHINVDTEIVFKEPF
ncbi:hypothetical protein VE02_03878 [Pseudogymnoascus sp. 03VT05]|nr:hypothetical protein VE02_03878 [Pseudogymnoascus sp. 03VT05]